jgi:hypothetical protein
MKPLQLKVQLVATCFCLQAILACLMMWYEAGLHEPGRPLNFFGGSNRVPFFQQKYPEASLAFNSLLILSLLATTWFPHWNCRPGEEKQPFWSTHGLGYLLIGSLMALFFYQVRYINGVPMDVLQIGYLFGLVAAGGIILTGITVLLRGLYR